MKKRLSHSDLCSVAKLDNEIGTGTNRRRKTKGSGTIALSCLTRIHSSAAAASNLLASPWWTMKLRPWQIHWQIGFQEELHLCLSPDTRACSSHTGHVFPSSTPQHPFMTLSASSCIHHAATPDSIMEIYSASALAVTKASAAKSEGSQLHGFIKCTLDCTPVVTSLTLGSFFQLHYRPYTSIFDPLHDSVCVIFTLQWKSSGNTNNNQKNLHARLIVSHTGLQENVGAQSPSSDLQQRGDHRLRNLSEIQASSSTKRADPKLNWPELWAELSQHRVTLTYDRFSCKAKHGEQNAALRKTVEITTRQRWMQSWAMNFQPLETNSSGNKWTNDGNKKAARQCVIGILHSVWHLEQNRSPSSDSNVVAAGRQLNCTLI